MNDYERRLSAATAELDAAGFWKSHSQPPFFRIMQALGLKPRPPHYAAFGQVWLWLGVCFGVFWGLGMYVTLWQDMPIWISILGALLGGLSFGHSMAPYYKKGRAKHALSNWEDL